MLIFLIKQAASLFNFSDILCFKILNSNILSKLPMFVFLFFFKVQTCFTALSLGLKSFLRPLGMNYRFLHEGKCFHNCSVRWDLLSVIFELISWWSYAVLALGSQMVLLTSPQWLSETCHAEDALIALECRSESVCFCVAWQWFRHRLWLLVVSGFTVGS